MPDGIPGAMPGALPAEQCTYVRTNGRTNGQPPTSQPTSPSSDARTRAESIAPFYVDDAVTLYYGDCLDILAGLPDSSVDAVVTDPPYGLGFMGKAWDAGFISGTIDKRRQYDGDPSPKAGANGGRYDLTPSGNATFQVWSEQWAAACLRVLKPGGHMLAFGGSRTWHRLACAVEDAGFEIRDSIAWLCGSGFPKSLDVSKAIDKAAGAERQIVGRAKGVGARDPDSFANGHSTEYDATVPATDDARTWQGWGTALKPAFEPVVVARKPLAGTVAGNVLQYGTGALNIDECRVRTDESLQGSTVRDDIRGGKFAAGHRANPGDIPDYAQNAAGRWPANVVLDDTQATALDAASGILTSGASRFFPTFRYEAKAPTLERPRDGDTAHPTVKPLDLMRWLVRLVTPPGGLVLDPFAGSGTTAEACVVEGFRCITVEREADYLPLIVARLSKPIQTGFDLEGLA